MEESSMLLNLAKTNRLSYQSRQVLIQKRSSYQQENNATILEYSSTTGQYKVQDMLGNIYLAKAISNSSALAIGSQVSLSFPQGGVPVIDAMPR